MCRQDLHDTLNMDGSFCKTISETPNFRKALRKDPRNSSLRMTGVEALIKGVSYKHTVVVCSVSIFVWQTWLCFSPAYKHIDYLCVSVMGLKVDRLPISRCCYVVLQEFDQYPVKYLPVSL